MKTWEIIRYNPAYGMSRQVVEADNVYNALVNTGNSYDQEIISVKVIPNG